jgi:hypothetical integral membrane protein (TIGR02206 family)
MGPFFSADYAGPAFAILGPAHVAALTTILLLNLVLLRFRHAAEGARSGVRLTLAIALWTAELAWHIWNLAVGSWRLQNMLPLNICSIFIWLSGFMLLHRDYRIYEFAYFLGIGAAMQYLATPDLGIYGFPHFRFFEAFISHGLLLTAPIYMTLVEGFRPTWKSLMRVALWTNVYMAMIYVLNSTIGSDFLMLNAKPATPSLLDLLPPWPYYIVFMELVGLSTLLLLYVPFLISDWKKVAASAAGQARWPM